ncbi:MAG: DUF1638 domain-containing protein [Treponema sp.]|jgi:hypothetical protein|nr:DUF1638 domain-containing protein [Treponema sp.]
MKKLSIPVLSCGIYQTELDSILPELERELGVELSARYLPPALDVNETRLAAAIAEGLPEAGSQEPVGSKEPVGSWEPGSKKSLLLYGRMCHTDMAGITRGTGAVFPAAANCVEAFLSPERKREMDAAGNVYYLTMSGLKLWREIYQQGHGWDAVDARINFGSFDKIVALDCGLFEITEEALFDFFEFTQVPVEVEPITLDYFKGMILDLCRQILR